ncbi:MAG TPA: AraC family transcriptional regulator [Chitinispirillaceae bacterium]|nr:AraC family transcriptional regulator [Chitinispirillaceae bacterium]
MHDPAIYLSNLKKTIEYIDKNLKKRLSLKEIAEEACYSQFHFHRIFTRTTGQTLKDYIRKRRISEAAKELVSSDKSIRDLSYEYCFLNQESFTRAFYRFFLVSPRKYRYGGVINSIVEKMEIGNVIMSNAGNEISTLMLQSHPARYFIGMKYSGSNNNDDIFDLTYSFLRRKNEIKHCIDGEQYYGLAQYRKDNSGNQVYDFYAGMRVDSLSEVPEGMIGVEIPPEDYAVVTYRGNSEYLYGENTQTVYTHIYETLLPEYGLHVKENSMGLQTDNSFRAVENDFTKIYIPVNV